MGNGRPDAFRKVLGVGLILSVCLCVDSWALFDHDPGVTETHLKNYDECLKSCWENRGGGCGEPPGARDSDQGGSVHASAREIVLEVYCETKVRKESLGANPAHYVDLAKFVQSRDLNNTEGHSATIIVSETAKVKLDASAALSLKAALRLINASEMVHDEMRSLANNPASSSNSQEQPNQEIQDLAEMFTYLTGEPEPKDSLARQGSIGRWKDCFYKDLETEKCATATKEGRGVIAGYFKEVYQFREASSETTKNSNSSVLSLKNSAAIAAGAGAVAAFALLKTSKEKETKPATHLPSSSGSSLGSINPKKSGSDPSNRSFAVSGITWGAEHGPTREGPKTTTASVAPSDFVSAAELPSIPLGSTPGGGGDGGAAESPQVLGGDLAVSGESQSAEQDRGVAPKGNDFLAYSGGGGKKSMGLASSGTDASLGDMMKDMFGGLFGDQGEESAERGPASVGASLKAEIESASRAQFGEEGKSLFLRHNEQILRQIKRGNLINGLRSKF